MLHQCGTLAMLVDRRPAPGNLVNTQLAGRIAPQLHSIKMKYSPGTLSALFVLGCTTTQTSSTVDAPTEQKSDTGNAVLLPPAPPKLRQFEPLPHDEYLAWLNRAVEARDLADSELANAAKNWRSHLQRSILWLEHYKLREKLGIQTITSPNRGHDLYKAGFIQGARASLAEQPPKPLKEAWSNCERLAPSEADRGWCAALKSEVMKYDEEYSYWLWDCEQVGEVSRRSTGAPPQVQNGSTVHCPTGEVLTCEEATTELLMRSCLAGDLYKARWLSDWGSELGEGGDRQTEVQKHLLALEVDPGDAYIMNSLAWVLATTANDHVRDPERALPYVEYILTVEPEAPWFLDTAAGVFAALGQFERAIAFERKAIQLEPGSSKADYEEALKLYEQGQPFRE